MKYLFFLLLFVVSSSAFSDNAWQFSKQIERSMVITGTITVNSDGSVQRYTIDQQDKLLPEIVELVGKTVPTWRFQSISGNEPSATATMNIRVVADKLKEDQYSMSITGASFGTAADHRDEWPYYKEKVIPRYPDSALRAAVGGTVYVAALINRLGTVDKAEALQVDLRAIADKYMMENLSSDLAQASVMAVKKFTFNIPQQGPYAAYDHWAVRIAVNFKIAGKDPPEIPYGRWDVYVPGPIHHVSWLESQEHIVAGSADAIPDNDFAFQDDPHFVLLTPPSPG